jgi:hypothetical protein
MKGRQDAVLDALQRAHRFLDENAALLTGVDLTAARPRPDAAVTNFTTHALDHDVGTRSAQGETAKQCQLRIKWRRDQMEPIALIVRRNSATCRSWRRTRSKTAIANLRNSARIDESTVISPRSGNHRGVISRIAGNSDEAWSEHGEHSHICPPTP